MLIVETGHHILKGKEAHVMGVNGVGADARATHSDVIVESEVEELAKGEVVGAVGHDGAWSGIATLLTVTPHQNARQRGTGIGRGGGRRTSRHELILSFLFFERQQDGVRCGCSLFVGKCVDHNHHSAFVMSVAQNVTQHVPFALGIEAAQLEIEAIFHEKLPQSLVGRRIEVDTLNLGREALPSIGQPAATKQDARTNPRIHAVIIIIDSEDGRRGRTSARAGAKCGGSRARIVNEW